VQLLSVLHPRHLLIVVALVAASTLLPGALSIAQEIEAPGVAEAAEPIQLKTLSDDQIKSLDADWASIQENMEVVDSLSIRAKKETGIMREVLETRLDRLFTEGLESAINFAENIADLRDDGYDVSAYMDNIQWLFENIPYAIREAADNIRERTVLPDFSQSAAKQAAIDTQFFAGVEAYNKTNKALIRTAKVAARFTIDSTELQDDVRQNLADGAANSSVFLDLALTQSTNLRAGVAALPDDAELKAQLKVADDRIKRIAMMIESNLAVMSDMGLPTTQYKQQLLTATGSLTVTTLDVEVITGLLRVWGGSLKDKLKEQGPGFVFKLLMFFAIIYVFIKLAGWVQRGVNRALNANKQHMSRLLRSMISQITKNLVIIFGVFIALSQIGISLAPLLAGLGIMGFIIGFALQDSLSNFASGLMILFYRPFDVGDTIEAAGARGQVSSMSLVNTTILTFDNQTLIIPNNKIWQDVIMNVTSQRRRRIDMEFGIAYDEDIDRVEKLLLDLVSADERVLDEPKPTVKVGSFGDSSVNLLLRPWVKTDDYWEVLWDLNKRVKQAFDREGIIIPFPQRDVHVFQDRAPKSSSRTTGSFDTPDAKAANEPAEPEDS